ncbi:hypothetical protein EJ06DRAFT_70847 [Trichodelitschia bisporula]|uniref:Shugoshin n=1 Tax=Trichodelitschia bisporula TaxID=703511 RepID=A0A6G1HTP1_9PEZI|nr:hypothetical protein EJ06DRAFT_70847 [Trichodelitschia bisporula]
MARLNEAFSAPDSIDILRKRFIRQNRELAKANSTQSIRIRCLEDEVSRLLTDNLALREEINQIRVELEGVAKRNVVFNIKEQLEAQVKEMGRLLSELDTSQTPDRVKTAVAPRHRRGEHGMSQGGEDGKLPTIREDKHYPRSTLNAEEIQRLTDEALESPDLGPPPIGHFHDEEPIKYDPEPQVDPCEREPDADALASQLSANIETRGKRRDVHQKLAIKRMAVFNSPPERIEDDNGAKKTEQAPVRAGSKRKLGARDDEPKLDSSVPVEFTFSRKGAADKPAQSVSDARPKAAEERKLVVNEDGIRVVTISRKALGEKTVNTDPIVSPQKPTKAAANEKPPGKKPIVSARPRPKSRTEHAAALSIRIPPPEQFKEPAQAANLHPKTPAPADFISPPSTQPSTRSGPKDTPPPTELNPHATTEANGRPGRRARAAVNYAEPNLISKMRRPTKELLDAVGKDGKPLSIRTVVKKEPGDSDSDTWKALPGLSTRSVSAAPLDQPEPASPLSKRSEARGPVQTEAEEQPAAAAKENKSQRELNAQAAAAHQIVKLASERRKSARPASVAAPPAEHASSDPFLSGDEEQKRASLAIFDFDDSSPVEERASVKGRGSRRHSSNPAAEMRMREGVKNAVEARVKSEAAEATSRGDRAAARRRSMML